MPRHMIAVALFLAVGALAVLVGTSQAEDSRGCETRHEGRFELQRAKGNDVVVIDTVTGAVYRTEDKLVTTIDVVGGRVTTRTLEVRDQRGGTVIRAR